MTQGEKSSLVREDLGGYQSFSDSKVETHPQPTSRKRYSIVCSAESIKGGERFPRPLRERAQLCERSELQMRVRGKFAFTLAEMMVVLLILTICLAAFAPLMTKRRTVDISSPWRYASNNSDIYYGMGSTQTAMIGQNSKSADDNARLIINTTDNNQRQIVFRQAGTYVGHLRMDSDGNTALGINVLNADTTSVRNTALGYNALPKITSGNDNVALGHNALYALIDGDGNSAVGVNNIPHLEYGDGNVGVGHNTFFNLVNGNYNTAVGRYACINVVGGSNKTCIGANSGPTATDSSSTEIVYLGSSSTTGIVSGVSSISVYSDKRLKDVKEEYKKGLEQIRNIVPKLFVYKSDKEKNVRLGVIAQELQKVLPEAVVKNGDGYLIVHQEYIQYALLNAVKQLDKIVQSLITEVKTMVAKLSYHDNKIKKLEQECADLKQENNAMKQENAELKARLEKLEKFVF